MNAPRRNFLDSFRISTFVIRISPVAIAAVLFSVPTSLSAAVVLEVTSPYHHIRVLDEGGMRTLCFDDSTETRMSLQNPMQGHFEYTEYFHMAWLWNTQLVHVLMVGLGGASAQRSFEQYYPGVTVQTVEIDPLVVQVAREYFFFKESDRQKIQVQDGRVYLRRTGAKYDCIILDAYVKGRYGAGIPQHLATREFFELVRDHLSSNGVAAYNVIGTVSDWHADIVGAIYRTMNAVFPQVYLFPARSSRNVVLLATRSSVKADLNTLRQRGALLVQTQRVKVPGFRDRLESFRALPPPNVVRSPILTDDYAPVEGLSGSTQ